MKRIPLDDVTPEQWLESRRGFVNASEVAIVCGEAQWGSLAELYAEKKGLRPPRAETPPMRRGRMLERAAFDWLAEERPEWEVVRAKLQVVDEDKRQACTPDGFARAPDRPGFGVVQAKVVSRSAYRRKWLDDPGDHMTGPATPPAHYIIQTTQEMKLNELSWGVLAVLIEGEFGSDFQIFDIERNPVLEDRIDYHVAEFFARYLDPEIMPPYEPQRDELLIKTLYPQDDGSTIDLSGDNRALTLADYLTETQSGLKRLRDQEGIIKTELEGKLGPHTYGVLGDGRCISWKRQNRKGYVVQPSSYRTFRILKQAPGANGGTTDE